LLLRTSAVILAGRLSMSLMGQWQLGQAIICDIVAFCIHYKEGMEQPLVLFATLVPIKFGIAKYATTQMKSWD
jgi:hypothetical protein